MFFGTTGTGKTKFFILQIMQAILRNEVVIVIDPKADRELKEQMIECSKLCLKEKQFYCLDLNEPDSSKQSFNLLSVCKDECKIAEQIIACISKEDDLSSDAFKSYAQNAIMNTIIALKELNYDLNFANIKNHLSLDTYYEAIKVMMIKFVASINTYYAYDYTQRFFKGIGESVTKLKTSLVEYGFDESLFSKDANKDDSLNQDSLDDETLENSTKKKRSASKYGTVLFKAQALRKLYLGLLDKYELKGEDEFISKSIETEIDGEKVVLNSPVLNLDKERDPAMPKNKVTRNLKLESLFDQCMIDETYFVKMTNSPDGLLNALSQNGFDRILNSRNNAVDLRQIYNESGILYVSLNSLVNRLRAVSVGKLILSELTSLSSLIYNADGSLNATDKRVNIFVDEAGEIITQELVMLLNKSRGANFALTLATQSYADLCRSPTVPLQASKSQEKCDNSRSRQRAGARTGKMVRGEEGPWGEPRREARVTKVMVGSIQRLDRNFCPREGTPEVSKNSRAPPRRQDHKPFEIKYSSHLQHLFPGTPSLPSAKTVSAPERAGRLVATGPLWCACGQKILDASASLRSHHLMN